MFRFLRLREADLPMVLAWRIKPRVADRMNTVVANDLEKHRAWFRGIKHPYWVIHHDERPIGMLNLAGGDSWGYYIGEDDAVPLGAIVPPYFYNWYFKDHAVLVADVKAGNTAVEAMHLFHGYRRAGLNRFELTREAWAAQANRYGHYVAEFE